MKIRLLVVSLLAFGVFMGLALGVRVQQASAADCDNWAGIGCFRGYFYGGGSQFGDDVIPGGMSVGTGDKQGFIDIITGYLNSGNPHLTTSAQYIILSMSGYGAGVGKDVTPAQYNDWVARINNPGISLVEEDALFVCGISNTYYQPNDDIAAGTANGSEGCGGIDTMIDFYNNATGELIYRIREPCGNPLGTPAGLPPYNPVQPWTAVGQANAPSAPEIYPGDSVRFNQWVHNNGPGTADISLNLYYNVNDGPATWTGCGASESLAPDGNSSSCSIWDFPILDGDTTTTKVCMWVGFGPVASDNAANGESPPQCVAVRQVRPTCSSMSYTPPNVGPTTKFTVSTNIAVGTDADANRVLSKDHFYINIAGPAPGTGSGTTYNFAGSDLSPPGGGHLTVTNAGGTLILTTELIGPTNNTGHYVVSWGTTGPMAVVDCGGTDIPPNVIDVSHFPYFDVLGGDLKACSQVKGWNNGAAGGYTGAATQIAALVGGSLAPLYIPTSTNADGSASGARGGGALEGTGLAFANTSANAGAGKYGGDYNSPVCAFNAIAPTASTDSGNSIDLTTAAAGVHVFRQDVTITASGSIPNGKKITVIVIPNAGGQQRDAIIGSNIRYASYSTIAQIPQVTVQVFGGDLGIRPGVTELHGFYNAQASTGGTPSGGYVRTCYASSPNRDSTDYATCNSPLKIYGALAGSHIFFERTFGDSTTSPAAASETIQYSPELWLGNVTTNMSNACTPSCKFDSLTSLAPVL